MNTLYYSKFCVKCSQLFIELHKYQLFSIFQQIICVDNVQNNDIQSDLPKFITCVPTIITPDYHVPLIDNTVWQWIYFKLYKRNLQKEHSIAKKTLELAPQMYASRDMNQFGKQQTPKLLQQTQKLREYDNELFLDNIDEKLNDEYEGYFT